MRGDQGGVTTKPIPSGEPFFSTDSENQSEKGPILLLGIQ